MKSPIFIFSLPRSGSTLLQRLLMGHEKIASVAEPWFLLPMMYAKKDEGVIAEYSHISSRTGVKDFIQTLENQDQDYYDACAKMGLDLYAKQCNNQEVYFLDKTPRYHLIIDEINKTFPHAKFIFLFRNPMDVFASMISTWGNNKLRRVHEYDIDLDFGFKNLSHGYEKLAEKSFALKYEELVGEPKQTLKKLCNYLEIEYSETMVNSLNMQKFSGNSGDPTGIRKYKLVKPSSVGGWRKTFNNTYKLKVLFNYIGLLNKNDLSIQGYSKEYMLADIKGVKTSIFNLGVLDFFDYSYSRIVKRFKLNLWFGSFHRKWFKREFLN